MSKGYDNPFSKVVKEIDGVKVKNLRHFVELLRDTKSKYTTIAFDDRFSETIVFDHQEALKATDEILSDNGIRQQASDDLIAVWKSSNSGARFLTPGPVGTRAADPPELSAGDYDGHCRRVNGFRFRDPRFAHVVPRQKVVHVARRRWARQQHIMVIDMRRVPERKD